MFCEKRGLLRQEHGQLSIVTCQRTTRYNSAGRRKTHRLPFLLTIVNYFVDLHKMLGSQCVCTIQPSCVGVAFVWLKRRGLAYGHNVHIDGLWLTVNPLTILSGITISCCLVVTGLSRGGIDIVVDMHIDGSAPASLPERDPFRDRNNSSVRSSLSSRSASQLSAMDRRSRTVITQSMLYGINTTFCAVFRHGSSCSLVLIMMPFPREILGQMSWAFRLFPFRDSSTFSSLFGRATCRFVKSHAYRRTQPLLCTKPYGVPKARYRNEWLAWNPREAENSTNSIQNRTSACQTWRKNRQLRESVKCHHHHDLSRVDDCHCHPRLADHKDIRRRNTSFSAIYGWLALAVNVFGCRPPHHVHEECDVFGRPYG